jgi:DNA-binding transcriptional ArsR family regulator
MRPDRNATGSLAILVTAILLRRFGTESENSMKGLDCIIALKALGEQTRLRILRLLFKRRLSVTEISERLNSSQYNISKHLRIMREAGLLEIEKRGQQHLYTVAPKLKSQVAANQRTLDLGCCTFRLDKLPK